MNRTVSFSYNHEKNADCFLDFFNELLHANCFNIASDEQLQRQFFTVESLLQSICHLKSSLGLSDDDLRVDQLGQKLISELTRNVHYRSIVFFRHAPATRVELVFCSENNFPVVGVDLWCLGDLALPAGFLTVVGEDDGLVVSLIGTTLAFKEPKSE